MKNEILNLKIEWPHCEYQDISQRLEINKEKKNILPSTAKEYLKMKLDCNNINWSRELIICIDGMSGIGKTFLAEKLKKTRAYKKINLFVQNLTIGSTYNLLTSKCLDYLLYTFEEYQKDYTNGKIAVVWDRSLWSNLIFYFVHNALGYYKSVDEKFPDFYDEKIFLILNNVALMSGLVKIIAWFCENTDNFPKMVFYACSDLKILQKNLKDRGSLVDIFNGFNFEDYQKAQFNVYLYFSTIVNAKFVDYAILVNHYKKTREEITSMLEDVLNFYNEIPHDDKQEQEQKPPIIVDLYKDNIVENQNLIMNFSCK